MKAFTNNGFSWSFDPAPQPQKSYKGAVIATVIIVCAIVSFAMGAAGATVAFRMLSSAQEETTTVPTPSNPPQTGGQNSNQTNNFYGNGSASSSGEGELETISDVVRRVADSVVVINVETLSGSSRGSGVIVTEDGKILTCYHVVEGARKITVTLNQGVQMDAEMVAGDAASDLAVIKVTPTEGQPLPYAVYGNSAELAVGERVIAIGNPLGTLGGTVTDGIISATQRKITTSEGNVMTLLQTNAAINQGNSGGGLFNMDGKLIGIVNAKYAATGVEGLAFAIPSDYAYSVQSDLLTYGYVRGRVDTGLVLQDVIITSLYDQYYYQQLGIYANGVYVVSSAYTDQLKNADRIVSINGVTVNSEAAFDAVIKTLEIGDPITITATRGNGSAFTVTIVLKEAVPNTTN